MSSSRNKDHFNLGIAALRTQSDENTVPAYYYRCIGARDQMDVLRGGIDITEFFIPSESLAFNDLMIVSLKQARNHLDFFIKEAKSPITVVYLPVSIVDRVKAIYQAHLNGKSGKPFLELKTDQEISQLFKNMSVLINEDDKEEGKVLRHLDPRFLDGEKDFEVAYQAFGNDALPNYIMKCILDGGPKHQALTNRLLNIINGLADPLEKSSLKACITYRIDNHNKEVEHQRQTSFDPRVGPAALGVSTGLLAMEVTDNPLVGLGVGVVTGAATFFGGKVNDQRQHEQFEKQKQLFFDALGARPAVVARRTG